MTILAEQQLEIIARCLRESLAWGRAYGQVIPLTQWEEMREKQVEQHLVRIKLLLSEEHEREMARAERDALAAEMQLEQKLFRGVTPIEFICRRCATGRVDVSHHRLCPAK